MRGRPDLRGRSWVLRPEQAGRGNGKTTTGGVEEVDSKEGREAKGPGGESDLRNHTQPTQINSNYATYAVNWLIVREMSYKLYKHDKHGQPTVQRIFA